MKSFYTEWYSSLVSYASRTRIQSASAAEDAVQEAFSALYSVRSPKGWTFCVLGRQIVKFRHQELKQRDAFWALHYSAIIGPADFAARREVEIDGLISTLTSREFEILKMRVKPMRYAEIAEHLGISVNTVKTLLARAIRKMQQAARRNYPESFEVSGWPAGSLAPISPAHSRPAASCY
jgi:RNA polymerase sigma factor (sigma-70 family)